MPERGRVTALVSAAGIDPRQGGAEAAALLVRRLALRTDGGDPGCEERTVARGWSGPEAFAGLMAVVTGAPRQEGTAFGSRWPWFEVSGHVVAPGLPVRLSPGVEDIGPDGAYSRNGGSVFREAVGVRKVFLDTQASGSGVVPGFSLLWFSDSARFLVRDSLLEVEDLFSRTTCRIDRNRLERLLVRGQRVDGDVMDGLSFEEESFPTTIEVARPVGSTTPPWQDPVAFLQSRIDVRNVTARDDRVVVEDVLGETIEFRATQKPSGWLLQRTEGNFPFAVLSFQRDEGYLILKGALASEVDIFLPGLRGRVVFDLHADLTAFLLKYQKV